jgi:hypothetical protein
MACALLLSAIAAQGASAVTGTTAFTCVAGIGEFADSHCKETGGTSFKHVAIPENTTTSLRVQSVGSTKLKATVGGIPMTLTSESLEGIGWMKNQVDAENKEHYIHAEFSPTFKGATVTGAGKECFVYEDNAGVVGTKGVITTEHLTATTTGQGDSIKITPATGGVLWRFWLTDGAKSKVNCVTGGTYEVSGSLTGKPSGATVNFTHTEVTTANTLNLGPEGFHFKAGIEGSLTLEAEDPENGCGSSAPLSVTTVTT